MEVSIIITVIFTVNSGMQKLKTAAPVQPKQSWYNRTPETGKPKMSKPRKFLRRKDRKRLLLLAFILSSILWILHTNGTKVVFQNFVLQNLMVQNVKNKHSIHVCVSIHFELMHFNFKMSHRGLSTAYSVNRCSLSLPYMFPLGFGKTQGNNN